MRTATVLLLVATLLSACGKEGGRAAANGPRSPVLTSPEVVLAQAHRALAAGDLAGLLPFLTADGRARLEADLRAWHAALRDPATGPRAAGRVPVPEDEAGRALARRAVADADPAALLWLLARADPKPPLPATEPAPRPADAQRVELLYPAPRSEWRRVVLTKDPDGWRIDRLQL